MNHYSAAVLTASFVLMLTGCAGGGSTSACEVLSPAQISLPTNQNDQRVESQTTGEPHTTDSHEQDC